jgi:hypothetical protein
MRIGPRATALLLAIGVLLPLAARFLDHTVDDAFISFRYAENLVNGHGLVFNAGERVEGYTNFLWVLLIAPFLALGVDPELAARGLGLAAATGTLAAVVRAAPSGDSRKEVVAIAPLLLASSPPFALWATGGLETVLFTCLVVWSAVLAIEDLEQGALRPVSSVALALASLTRPEGFGLACALGALLLALHRKSPSRSKELLRWGAAFLAIFVPYFLWRLSYYGDPLPNPFYAKVGATSSQLLRGLRYVHAYFLESGYWVLVPCAGLIWSRRRARVAVLGGLALAFLGYVVAVGGDGLPLYRFLVPILPLLFLLIAEGSDAALRRVQASGWVRVVAACLALALCARAALPAFRGTSARLVDQDRREVAAWKEIGAYFAASASPGASIAVIPAGAVPYFSRLRAIDMLGLNDRAIARRRMPALGTGQAGHEKYDVDYVLARRPTYVLVGVYGLSPTAQPAEQLVQPYYAAEFRLLESSEFRRSYRLERARTASGYFAYFRRAG